MKLGLLFALALAGCAAVNPSAPAPSPTVQDALASGFEVEDLRCSTYGGSRAAIDQCRLDVHNWYCARGLKAACPDGGK